MNKPRNILVTGASGFVGRLLLPVLAARFEASSILAAGGRQLPHCTSPCIRALRFLLLEPDVDIDSIFSPAPDLVIHLAAGSSVATSMCASYETMCTNLGGTMRLAELIRERAPGAAVVFASSGETYGASFLVGPARETDPIQPRNAYARSKAASEYVLIDMLADKHAVVILRLFNHTGPGQDRRFVVPSFAAQIAAAERTSAKEILVGNLDVERDFLDVRDVVEAYVRVAARAPTLTPGVFIFNVCSGESILIRTVLDMLIARAQVPLAVKVDSSRLRVADIPRATGVGSLFMNEFNWSPRYRLADTLDTVLDYWRGCAPSA